ncbi:hypothetical protein TNCV_2293761 [Trichonephila clavipes]|nr:hypothetical protein TNCV_2293761 [Trichonephila clavipes]
MGFRSGERDGHTMAMSLKYHWTNFFLYFCLTTLIIPDLRAATWMWRFEPSTTKDPPCRAAMHVKSVEAETSSRWCGVVVRRGGASSGVVHVT